MSEEAKQETKETSVPEETVETPETEGTDNTEASAPLEKAEETIANLTDRLMRTAAEFDNFKKRSQREKGEIYSNAVCDTVEKILPVLDNLERAIATSGDSENEESILDGIKMIQKQFTDALSSIGVTAMDAVGTPFDPEKHNAVMTEESEETENTVLEELMKGYLYHDKVIRHAMVKVSL